MIYLTYIYHVQNVYIHLTLQYAAEAGKVLFLYLYLQTKKSDKRKKNEYHNTVDSRYLDLAYLG